MTREERILARRLAKEARSLWIAEVTADVTALANEYLAAPPPERSVATVRGDAILPGDQPETFSMEVIVTRTPAQEREERRRTFRVGRI